MRNAPLSLFASICLAVPVASQVHYPVGNTEVKWDNPTSSGESRIRARIFYPAVYGGENAPVLPAAEGWPTLVFLHGYGMLGDDYSAFGEELATAGFAAVMLNTARYNYSHLHDHALALFDLLDWEDQRGTHLLGAFDMNNVGVIGHSMGGGVAGILCADTQTFPNPGYKVGLAIAPVFPGPIAGHVHVPFGVVSGEGDPVTLEALHADPFYDALQPAAGLKFHYSMGIGCDHDSIVGINVVGGVVDQGVFQRSVKVAQGFFRHFLGKDPVGLDTVFGPGAISDANFDQLKRETIVPQVWADRGMSLGGATRISITSEDGFAALVASIGTVTVPLTTQYGDLLIDPSSMFTIVEAIITEQQLDVLVTLPVNTNLIGLPFAVQGLGETPQHVIRLGSAVSLTIEP